MPNKGLCCLEGHVCLQADNAVLCHAAAVASPCLQEGRNVGEDIALEQKQVLCSSQAQQFARQDKLRKCNLLGARVPCKMLHMLCWH